MSVMRRLRAETRGWHDALEATPFSLALGNRTLPLDRYVGQLTAYRIILSTLETRLATTADATVAAVWHPDLTKMPLLDRDLAYFSQRPAGEFLAETVGVAERIAMAVDHREPAALLGFLYVFEGSTLGALELTQHVRAAFQLPDDHGLAYYTSGDRTRWAGFSARMDAALTHDPRQEDVLAAATTAYRWIADVLDTLSPRVPAGEHTSL